VWNIKYSGKHGTLFRLLNISYQLEAVAVKLTPFADVQMYRPSESVEL
jgi:hypothetical protein